MRKGPGTPMERFWRRIDMSGACWLWIGRIDPKGYGRTDLLGEHNGFAHRLAYKLLVSDRLERADEFDHTCHTTALRNGLCSGGSACLHRRCVNPSHLELVTHKTNVLRGASLSAQRARQTHCSRGHALSDGNVRRDRYGRHCITCNDAAQANYRESHREEACQRTRAWRAQRKADL